MSDRWIVDLVGTKKNSFAVNRGVLSSAALTAIRTVTLPDFNWGVSDAVYDATTWNNSKDVATKGAIRNKIETITGGIVQISGTPIAGQVAEWTNANTLQGVAVTGSGSYIKNNSPTLITPNIGTPSAGNLANCTFPTLNQNTTGSAAKWTTARNLAGNSVDGSANVAFSNKFIVQGTADAGLSGAQFLGTLITGILKNTTTTGVLSIAGPSDFPILNQSTTGSAATLTTPRAINGVNFDGSAPITVTAAAGTLSGSTLASGVTASSLVSFGNSPTLVTPDIGTPSAGNLANCTFPTLNQSTTGYASALKSASTTVDVAAATAPSAGQVLTATDSTHATWQTPGAGSGTVTSVASADGSIIVTNPTTTPDLAVSKATSGFTITGGNTSIGAVKAQSFFSAMPVRYSTGTVSQSGTTVTGVGTTFVATMVGDLLTYANGTQRIITAYTDATHLTVNNSGTVSSQAYTINYPGLNVFSTGEVVIGGTTNPNSNSQLYVYGGASGANIDVRGNAAQADQAIIELEGSDYDSIPNSAGLFYYGVASSASLFGFSAPKLGALVFTAATTALIGTTNTTPLIFAINNAEVGRWDSNGNLNANVLRQGYATTATAAGTTTLTVASAQQQYFTGTTTQTVKLPVTSTLALGFSYTIINNSSGVVTVQSSGANSIQAMAANTVLTVTCILTSGTGAASWNAVYALEGLGGSGNVSNTGTPTSGQTAEWTNATTISGVAVTGTGNYVKATSPALTTPDLGTPSAIVLTNATGFPTLNQNTTGTAANLSGTPALPNGTTATTQAQFDNSTKLATTAYVDTAFASFDAKPQVAYASTSALPANTYANGSSGVGATLTGNSNGPLIIDGVTLVIGQAGERVLVAGESTSANNGWYSITQVGVVAVSPYILTRTTESDQGAEIGSGYITSVVAPNTVTPGSSNNGKVFISVAAADPFVVGTTNLTFSAVGGVYTAGNGLTLSGSSFVINTAITVDLNTAQVLTNKDLSSGTNTFPTFNQNTTGSAAKLSISGQTGLLTFTGLASTNRIKTIRDAADTILELGGSYTPTGNWTSLTMITPVLGTPASGNLANCTFPTLNQNTTGSAATLTTPRAINGVNFDGSTAITVTAAAGTLSGTTLNSTVVTSSLTSVGTLSGLIVLVSDSATSGTSTGATYGHDTSGTAAAGFGSVYKYQLQDSTTADIDAANVTMTWATATHASRKARVVHNVYDTAARETFREEASGTAPMIGFLGANASAALASPDVGTALTTFGLATGTPTFNAANLTGSIAAARIDSNLQQTLIYGLLVTQSSSTAIAVSAGVCWDPSSNTIISYAGGTNSPSLGASHFYAVYLYSSSGTATLDIQQEDPPSTAYAGTARKRATGNGGRYIGSFLTDASSHVIAVTTTESAANQVTVNYNTDESTAPFRVLAAGTASTYTSQSFATVAPAKVTNEIFVSALVNVSGTAPGNPAVEFSLDGTNRMAIYQAYVSATNVYPNQQIWLPMNPSTPSIYYKVSTSSGTTPNTYLDCSGYKYTR